MSWINGTLRSSVEDRFSFEGYTRRYRLNPESVKVQEAFKVYLLHKIDPHAELPVKRAFKKVLIAEMELFEKNFPDEVKGPIAKNFALLKNGCKGASAKQSNTSFSAERNELRSPSLSFKRLKHLAYLLSLTPQERQQLQSMARNFDLNERNLPKPRLFARGFHQMADSSAQWELASQLQSNEAFRSHFDETLSAHPFNEAQKEVEKMEQDLAQIPNSSLFKQYLRGRGALDREGKLIKAETPLETKQMIDCYLQLLAQVLELDENPIAAIDLKAWDEKVALTIYDRFSVAVGKNPTWKNKLSDVQNSNKSPAEKIVEIRDRLSGGKQVQKLLDSLSFNVESEHLDRFLQDPTFSSLNLGFPSRSRGLVLEEWKAKQALNALYQEDQSDIRSKVEDLCRAIGAQTLQNYTVYELYLSYSRAFKESCSQLQNPLHVLLAKEAYLTFDTKVLEKLRPQLPHIDTSSPALRESTKLSPTDSARTSNESPALENDEKFQKFILDKGLAGREGTREYRELLTFARDLYENPIQSLLEIEVAQWSPTAKQECFKWLLDSFFTVCLDVDLESGDDANLQDVLESFGCHAEEEIERLGLPSIYIDMLVSSLVSGNVKRLKLIAAEIAYARYREANPHTEIGLLKTKTVFEKIDSTKKYLKKMEDKAKGYYFLSYMESFPVNFEKVSEQNQQYLDTYLKGSYRDRAFYKYLEENRFAPLNIAVEKRLPYLFYIQKQFVKELVEKAQKIPYRNQGGAALVCELKETGFLDLPKLDVIADLIKRGDNANMDLYINLKFSAAARKLFVDSVLSPDFDVIDNFKKIEGISSRKALLEALEKGGHYKFISCIILNPSLDFYISGYEWLRDKIQTIPQEDFMSFYEKYFTLPLDPQVLENRHRMEDYCKKFQVDIKQEKFLGSPIRSFLEQEGIIDENGDLTQHRGPGETIRQINSSIFTQKDFIRISRRGAIASSQIEYSSWDEALTEVNEGMKFAQENNVSFECDMETVKAEIRKAAEVAPGDKFFSGYLKRLEIESIEGLSPRKLYELELFWEQKLISYFQDKQENLQPNSNLLKQMEIFQKELEDAIKRRDWDSANKKAGLILLIESLTTNSKSERGTAVYLNILSAKNIEDLVSKKEKELGSHAQKDQDKWVREIEDELEKEIKSADSLCLQSLVSHVRVSNLSIPEKKVKVASLTITLGKVLRQEFERLGMSPSYKDLIDRALSKKNGSLWDFLSLEALYAEYQRLLEDLKNTGFDSSELENAEMLLVDDPFYKKIIKIVTFLFINSHKPHYSELQEALSQKRLTELVKAELENKDRTTS